MTSNKEIGLRIELRRKQLGLTLDEIASQVGVARSTIQRYEKGSIDSIKLPVLDSIANVLKVNSAWLACKTDQNEEKPTTVSDDGLDPEHIKLLKSLSKADLELVLSVALQMKQREDQSEK